MDADGADTTRQIIGGAIRISRDLGCGFLEKVYESALAHELRKVGLNVEQQRPFSVLYDGVVVGEYRADLVIASSVIVEVKAAKTIDPVHEAQLLNYLRATGLKIGLILNFGRPRLGIKRMIN
jgi:GxxExxY protein